MSEQLSNPEVAQGAKTEQSAYVTLAEISGAEGGVSVTFLNATFLKKGHARTYPGPDFGAWLIDRIYNQKKLMAARKGMIRKTYFCPACNAQLDGASASQRSIEYELQYADLRPFTLRIAILASECPQCQKVSAIDARGKLTYQLNEAMIHAFEAGKVRP